MLCENCAEPFAGAGVLHGRYCTVRCYRTAWARAKRQTDPAVYREEMRERRRDPEFAARQRASAVASAERNRGRIAERQRLWYRENREKADAERTARRAVARGTLEREPCLFCGGERVHAHHHDYSQPLAVTWLCPRHHGLAHRIVEPAGVC